eukprot:TRINITY_DN4577_c0_g1_i1.p1 TRINITY_DN4577_c0_g1~~TRINITY_DN4577_c0_g1_i1.p1  ORF type:complete len:465 (+),score=172.89 TRINITY_DN4577_c0_g1_i1:156-1550(+)
MSESEGDFSVDGAPEDTQKKEASWKIVAGSMKEIFLDMGGWGVGDIAFGLRYVSKNKEKERKEKGTSVPEGNITDKDFIAHLDYMASLVKGAYGGSERELLARTMLKPENILKMDWKSSVTRPAYYIAVDDRINAVVLGIRGTASFKDALTDMVATLDPFMNGMAHRGIVRAAKWFETNVKEELKKFTQEKKLPLVIVGHSLGAGTASLLTLLLKDDFPGIKCYALAPPALISRELIELSREYVTSIITEDDLVPRFSTRNVERLREEVVNYPWATELKEDVKEWKIVKLAGDTKEKISDSSAMHKLDEGMAKMKLTASNNYKKLDAKYKVTERASTVGRKMKSGAKSAAKAAKTGAKAAGKVAVSAGKKVASIFKKKTPEEKGEGEEEEEEEMTPEEEDRAIAAAVDIFPPGKIHHVIRHEGRHYMYVADNEFFNSIVMSDTYMSDHCMDSYVKGLHDILRFM